MLTKILTLVILFHGSALAQTKPFIFEIYNYNCSRFGSRLAILECDFQKLAFNSYGLNLRTMAEKSVGKKCAVRVLFDIRPPGTQNDIRLVDFKVGLCAGLRGISSNHLLKFLFAELKRSSNAPSSCPFQGNVLYKMENYTITDALIPTHTPFANFTYICEVYEGNQLLGRGQVEGALLPKTKIGRNNLKTH